MNRIQGSVTVNSYDPDAEEKTGMFSYTDDLGTHTGHYKYTKQVTSRTVTETSYDNTNYFSFGGVIRSIGTSALYIYDGDDSNAQRDINGLFNRQLTSLDPEYMSSTEQRYVYYISTSREANLRPNLVYELAHYEYTVRNRSGETIMTGTSKQFIDTDGNVRDSDEDIAMNNGSSASRGISLTDGQIYYFYTANGKTLSAAGISSNLSVRNIDLTETSGNKNYLKLRYDDTQDYDGSVNRTVSVSYMPTKQATRSFYKSATQGGVATETHYSMYVPDSPMKELNIQAAANTAQAIKLKWNALTNSVIGIVGINTLTRDKADACITDSDVGIAFVSRVRSYFGAMQNRMEHTYDIDLNTAENTQASESLIRDADMADEVVAFSASDILAMAAQAMLSQANQHGQGVLNLLR